MASTLGESELFSQVLAACTSVLLICSHFHNRSPNPCQRQQNTFATSFRVSIVPADSSYSLEKGDDRGAAGHVFRPGDELSSDANQFPSTASYQDGVIAGTGIRIFDIKEIKQSGKDTIMKFSVLFEGDTMPPSVAPTAFPTIESPEPQLFSREIGEYYCFTM